jgi:hypothetical protein
LVIDDEPAAASSRRASRIEIVTPNGHRVLVDGDVDDRALARVLAAVARA